MPMISAFYLMLSSVMCWMMFTYMMLNKLNIMIEWNLTLINSLKFEFTFMFDWMNMIFMSTVMMISSIVIIYSINYMEKDLYIKRFMHLILIFVSSMILMISSPNMISILLGWDGLGLSSYCLVAYYLNKKSFNASMITILMNRIGDIMILISISLLMNLGSWNFLLFKKMNLMLMILLMIITFTKSAQIPFSSWLPLAMAAPTPISSLVHSSTLVTAGVYLLIRFNYLMSNTFIYLLTIMSCLTMFMSGLTANFEFDLKKIIALSTLSQLGLMIFSISLNMPKIAFFHLITHAMFKSLLFLCSGIMIHNYWNNQDIRFMSMMNMNIPLTNLIFNVSSLTLSGMPFLTGFYSKDLIIEFFLMKNSNYLILPLMMISMLLTICYTFRLIFYISIKNFKLNMFNFYNSFNLMNYSIFILLMLSMIYGSILNWIIFSSLNYIFLPKNLKMLIYPMLMLGMTYGIYSPKINYKIFNIKMMLYMYSFINFMWLLPMISKKNKMNLFKLNNMLLMYSDCSWLELYTSKMNIQMLKKPPLYKKKNLNFLMIMMMTLYFILVMTLL